jgi:glutathione S-transferase
MARYQLISFKTCPWVQRAAIVLREKKVDFEFVHIDSANRPDWFDAISPHGKVPVLRIDGNIALFESNAIAEYLDDTIAPRLHPEDPVARALNRAWTDYLPTFAGVLSAVGLATTEPALRTAREAIVKAFSRIEDALNTRGAGPYFNGASFALLDASYAPFLQRYLIVEELAGDAFSREFPATRRWAEALVDRPTTHTFPPDVFRALYLDGLKSRGSLIALRSLGS